MRNANKSIALVLLICLRAYCAALLQGPGGEIIEKPAANPPVHRVSPSRGRRRSRTPAANQLIEQAIDLANKARDAGHHDESAAAYGRALLLKPGESRAYYGLG